MLYGEVSFQEGTLKGRIISDGVLKGHLMIAKNFDNYTGTYTITPKIISQSIPTANKLMNDDVTVNGIPYYEVTNQQGGTTFIIAEN